MRKLIGVYGDPKRALREAQQLGLVVEKPIYYTGEPVDCQEHIAIVIWAPHTRSTHEAVVDAWGRRGLFAFNNSGCPRNPQVARRFLGRIEELAQKGCKIVVDALRYPSPHDGRLMLSCFCTHCLKAQPRLEALRRNLLEAIARRNPESFAQALTELAEARAEAVEELAAQARDKARAYGVGIEAAVFPPSISWLVGQRLDRLARIYDRLQVMLYHKCGGPACHNHEHASLQKLLSSLGLPVKEALEHLGITPPAPPEILEEQGTPPAILTDEWRRAASLAGSRAVPILWLDNILPRVLDELKPLEKLVLFAPSQKQ